MVLRDDQFVLMTGRRKNAISLLLFLCTAFAFLLRSTISPQILNMVIPYTSIGGSLPEKLHPGTYAVFIVFAAIFLFRPIVFRGEDVRIFKTIIVYLFINTLILFYLFAVGRATSSGFIVDTYFVGCAAVVIMLCFSEAQRRALGNVILGMLILSAMIGTVEAITHHRLLPYSQNELEFRPIGLAAHPLALGAFCATGIGFVAATRWPVWARVLCVFILLIGAAASGARAALLLAVAEIGFLLVFQPWRGLSARHQWQAKSGVLLLALVAGVALTAVLFSAGFLNRFKNTIFDENYMARITIYQVFEFVSWKNIIFGINADALLEIVNRKLHLPYIESTPVVITMLFGLPIALIFASSFLWVFFRLMVNAPLPSRIGGIVFLLTALSNNALSSKGPGIMLVMILLLAYRKPPGPKPVGSGSVRDSRLGGPRTNQPQLSMTSVAPTRLRV